jgi:acyl-CoA synthetase (NDP forming)
MPIDMLEEILHPQAVAVVGASENPTVYGYHFTRHLLKYLPPFFTLIYEAVQKVTCFSFVIARGETPKQPQRA